MCFFSGFLSFHFSFFFSSDAQTDWDADFVYDYHTLRVGGLTFAGVVVFLSFALLLGNRIRNCGKAKARRVPEEDA
ncbi:sodium/potassium-transporting ATPase subunit gamma [Austrofundulus limnaeus]|uniref:FXYD domain-containing ion transport regulator n=1 Tax=Austrofundulus limnaeus TaxID=52670 RepID=A0A2I4AYX8_AUSLI|nr:PREDICTED: sodium/potassium-transporting ATPase subunit gamma-like [Austrofundulus limnaeus]